jgi:tetratricopeptide (TPR) repeat protein
MRMKWIMTAVVAGCVTVGGVSGCQEQEKQKTIKEKAEAQWNGARSKVMLSLAQDQYKAGNFDKARQTVDDAAKLTPDAAPILVLSAKIAIEQGQLERADRELAIARTSMPNDAEAYYLSGVVCQRWQKPQEAFTFYQQASEKGPNEPAYLMAVSETLVGLDRSDEALALLDGKIIYFENSSGIRDAAARLLMTKKQYKRAAELFRQATILTPDEQSYREGLGLALYYSKQYKDAADVLGALVKQDAFSERADLRMALGESLLQLGKPRDARENLEVAARLQSGNAGVWLGLTRAAMESSDLKRAEASLKKALAITPDNAEAHLLLGYLRLRQEKLHDALAAFTKSSTLDRTDNVSVCMIGYVFERLGRKDAAAKCYAKALKMRPSDQMASQLMAGLNLND